MDKFTYMTTYKQEFCLNLSPPRKSIPAVVEPVDKVEEDCRGIFVPGIAVGLPPVPETLGTCPCQAGGLMPPRGAVAFGNPTNMDKKCMCFPCAKCPRPPNQTKLSPVEADDKTDRKAECRKPAPVKKKPKVDSGPGPKRREERKDPDVLKLSRNPPPGVIYGGEARNREEKRAAHPQAEPQRISAADSATRIPGPYWIRKRPDERRDVECPGRRNHADAVDHEQGEMFHGEGHTGGRCGRSPKMGIARREADVSRKKKEGPDAIYGQSREQAPGSSGADGFWSLERSDERRNPETERKKMRKGMKGGENMYGEEYRSGPEPGDEAMESGGEEEDEFPFNRPCECAPKRAVSGPDEWSFKRDWGRTENMDHDVEKAIRDNIPATRISCAPQAEVAAANQPNTFMKQLYQKYPYLYQVLRETPAEELASRVFKDKFLSTYQVDYLHMGVGEERIPGGGAQVNERVIGPEGEPEPQVIPGCSFRHGEKGNFGRKKQEENKKEKEEPVEEEEEKEEPAISEYMATVSRLGQEIMTDQLYKVAQIIKASKKENRK